MAFEAMGRPFESDRAYEKLGALRPHRPLSTFTNHGHKNASCALRTPQVRNPIKPPSQSGEWARSYSAGLALASIDAVLFGP
jgi:hypothetical protein